MSNAFFTYTWEVLKKIETTQQAPIDAAGEAVADAFANGHKVFATGSGHSHTFAEELYGRAGGLAFIIPMLTSELTLVEHPTKSTYIERLPGYAGILFELYGCDKGDVLLIASNSGRNAYTVEMALLAKEKGCTVVAVTNLTHSSQSTSRHSSGKLLKDIADIVIDNCGGLGDAAYHVAGVEETMAPTSSIANAVIAQAFSVKVAEVLHEKGIEVPVFCSANVDGGFQKNVELFKKYTRLY